MKSFVKFLSLALAALIITAAAPVSNKYILATGYTVTIHGTSNLHDWDETVRTVTGDGTIIWNTDGSFDLEAMNIKMEVHSIKSTEGSIMDNNTYKALKADNAPYIIFALANAVKSVPVPAKGHDISTKVNLTIAGVTRSVDMTVSSIVQSHSSITFEGSKTIKMTDFNVKPPVALFGALKTADEITIHFKAIFATTAI